MANKLFSHQEYQVKFFKAAVLSMAGASVFSSIFIFFAAGLLGLGPLLFIITSLLLYWFVAKTNRIRLASHLFLASLSAVILVLGILSGGVYGISIPGFFLLPPVAYFLLGQRAGTYWSIAAALSLGGVTAFENSIYASQVSNFVPEGVRKVLFGTILTLIFCTASVLAFIFERSRRQADNSVRSYSSYLQSVLQSISEALFVFSPGGTILMVNRAALQMLGFQESEIVGQNIGTILSTDKGYFDYSKVIGGATVSNERCRIKTSSGYDVSVLVTSSMLASGVRIGGGVLVARDLTAIDSLQSQLFQSQKTAAVGKLAGGIAHHLNNLLTVIVGAAEMIRLKEDTTKDSKQLAQMITDSSNRAAFLMQQVLSFSREQMLRPERLEIDKTLLGMSEVIKHTAGETVSVSIHANSHAEILVDKSLLEQIVMNLVTNACEAMPNGGKLTVETSVHDVEEPQVMIAVTDTGVGMDRETVSKLFEPFYTTKEVGQGVGLGLAAVHGIVKQSGGSVWAYSEPGRGTTLKIYLPKVGNAATYQADKTQIGSVKGKETILLAEDELVVRTLVSECLAKNGYHVIEATQGSEALDKAKERRGLIDLLLTDIVMPEMNGKELADALTAEFPKISVLFMSGYAGKAMLRQGVSLDGADFIQKPFVPDQLLLAVRKVLDQRLVVG